MDRFLLTGGNFSCVSSSTFQSNCCNRLEYQGLNQTSEYQYNFKIYCLFVLCLVGFIWLLLLLLLRSIRCAAPYRYIVCTKPMNFQFIYDFDCKTTNIPHIHSPCVHMWNFCQTAYSTFVFDVRLRKLLTFLVFTQRTRVTGRMKRRGKRKQIGIGFELTLFKYAVHAGHMPSSTTEEVEKKRLIIMKMVVFGKFAHHVSTLAVFFSSSDWSHHPINLFHDYFPICIAWKQCIRYFVIFMVFLFTSSMLYSHHHPPLFPSERENEIDTECHQFFIFSPTCNT